jgi:hypothetical protein
MALYHFRPDANKFAGIELNESDIGEHPIINPRILHANCFPVVELYLSDEPLLSGWSPPHATWEDDPPRKGDFPSLSSFWRVPICSEKAWGILKPLIGDVCEALPIQYPTGEPFYIIHVMRTIDCLDTAKATYHASPITGRVSQVYVWALKEKMLENQHIFKLPHQSGGDLLVDDVFRNAVESNRLKGLLFRPLLMTGTPEAEEMLKKVAKMEEMKRNQK